MISMQSGNAFMYHTIFQIYVFVSEEYATHKSQRST